MILDTLANHAQYAAISPRFARACAFLQQLPPDAAVGRHEIDGEEITIAPISIGGLEWHVLITEGFMRIGCQRHTHAEWDGFDDSDIEEMSGNALAFWAQWRAPLLAMCAAHASKATKAEVSE